MSPRPALFLDRDGTIVADLHYPRDPGALRLLPGAAAGIRRANQAGIPVVVVTNQSGIARGLLTEIDFGRVSARLDALLAREGAELDATFHCPHHPDVTGPCACRKPGTLLFERAAVTLDLDLARSVTIGDRWRDLGAARAFGGLGLLVPAPSTPEEERHAPGTEVVASLPIAFARAFAALGVDDAADGR
jgi:histidinol-phosphate phosphatase family protein